jgi:hypothetical protein
MTKAAVNLGFLLGSAVLAAAGAAAAWAVLEGEAARSAVLGVGLAWAAMAAGFPLLAAALESSAPKFLGAYAAGAAARLGALGAAAALAAAGWGRPAPLLLAVASTFLVLLTAEGALLWAASARR